MAKGRLISSEIALDPDLNAMSIEALLCYILAFTNLDRDGLIDAHPNKLWATICPMQTTLFDQLPRLVDEWIRTGKVIRYPIGGGQYALFFKDFRKYNLRLKYHNEAESIFPPPPGWMRSKAGLIPADPETRERMAIQFDRRSGYREALEAHLTGTLSRQEGDKSASESRESRDQRQDQDQTNSKNDDGDDQIIHSHHSVSVNWGGVGGDSLTAFDRRTLEAAALELGNLLEFGRDWDDYAEYIRTAGDDQLRALLRWIKRYNDDPNAAANVNSLPAVVISHIRKGNTARLSGNQEQELIELIMTYVTPDPWQNGDQAL
jgi:hypothetical protein